MYIATKDFKHFDKLYIFFCRNLAVLSFYTNSLNVANLGGDVHLNNAIGCALEIASFAATTFVLKKLGRKKTLIFLLVAFGCVFITTPLVKQRNYEKNYAVKLAISII